MLECASDPRLTALDSFTVEGSLCFAGGEAEVRDYRWAHRTDDVWSSQDRYFLHVCLTPAAERRAAYLDCDGRVAGVIGRIMLVPPGRRVRSGGAEGRQRSLHCVLDADIVDRLLPGPAVWSDPALASALHLECPEVEHLLLRLYAELRQPGFASDIMAESIATGIGIAIVRKFGLDRAATDVQRGGLAPWRMRRLRERVMDDAPSPGLGELAALCGMSVRHLSRAFRAETGMTVAHYVAHARIERAVAMLAGSDRPIGDIARAAGFGSAGSFSHAFRRATGMRPIDVRAGGGRPN